MVIVQQEDKCRYAGPVDFWCGQLMHATGIASADTLGRVRKRCVEAGLLAYVPGSRSRAARYWVRVPDAEVNSARTPRTTAAGVRQFGFNYRRVAALGATVVRHFLT